MAVTFITPVDVTIATAIEWTDCNVSAYVPEGATGVILHVNYTGTGSTRYFGVRKNGSADTRTGGVNYNHFWCTIGVDANRVFEQYLSNAAQIDVWLVGYFGSESVFFTDAVDKSISSGSWTDIDISSDTSTNTAIAAYFEVIKTDTNRTLFGLQHNSSSDDRTAYMRAYIQYIGAIVGVDGSEICEGYVGSTAIDFYLVGYGMSGMTMNTNGVSKSMTTTGSWEDLAALSTGAIGGIIECVTTSDNSYDYGLREDDTSEAILNDVQEHAWGLVECDGDRIVEGYIQNTDNDFYELGVFTAAGEAHSILPTGISSGIGLGAHTLSLGSAHILLPGGMSSGLGLGAHALGLWHTLLPTGVASGLGLGAHTLSLGTAKVLLPNGVLSGVGLGPHTLSLGTAQVVLPDGISSGLGLGSHTLTVAGLLILYPAGIASGLGLGTHTLSLGSAHVLLPDGVPSGLGLGAHTLATGSANILFPDGAVSGLGLGIHTLTSAGLLILYPQGIKSGLGLGNHTFTLGVAQTILPDGTISGIGIGPPVIGAESALILLPTGLPSGLGLGLLTLSGPASIVPKAIEIKLYEALVAHGALTALVASSIYPGNAAQGATLPSVVYDRVSGIRITSLSGYSNLENPLFQFDVYSENLDDLADIQDAIVGALAAATTFKAVPSTSPWDDWDDEVGLYRRVFDVSIWNKE